MCGICGFVLNRTPDFQPLQVLKRMKNAMTHRGPDDSGVFCKPPVFLGHTRLKIIDLQGGKQPMLNESGTVVVVYNGEIYNFQGLRHELEKQGHKFSTKSDTEVLVHLWEEVGDRVPEYLNGMFAFAIYDVKKGTVFLARDRMGQKPLYYSLQPAGFVFASELSALMENPLVQPTLDPQAVGMYMLYDSVPAPYTILRRVNKMEPGCCMTLKRWQLLHRRYWDITFPPPDEKPLPFTEAKEKFISLMTTAVKRRLISDVPLGVFLSGGIDSSTITALMCRIVPSSSVTTFCVGFSSPSFDESSFSKRVARKLRTRHYSEVLESTTMLELVPEIIARLDEPLADNSLIPTFLLSKFTKTRVTVALGGDGGDELCLGYPTFQAHRLARWYAKLPGFIRNAIAKFVAKLPVSTANISADYRAKRFVLGMQYPPLERHFVWIGSVDPLQQQQLFTSDYAPRTSEEVFSIVHKHLSNCAPRDEFDALIYLYAKLYMCDDILTKVDRASMMHSLEVRAPFLDPDVVEFFVSLPTNYKLRFFNMKYLMKKAMEPILGKEVVNRKKKGFGIPVASWFKGSLKPWVQELLQKERLKRWNIFDYDQVHKLWSEHLEGKKDNRKPLWSIVVLQLWLEEHL